MVLQAVGDKIHGARVLCAGAGVEADLGRPDAARAMLLAVDLVPCGDQAWDQAAPDEPASTRHEDPAHRTKSGYERSWAEIVRSPEGVGHAMPNAGSSQRTPAAASGAYACPIW